MEPTSKVVGQRFDVKFAEESWPPFQTRKAPEFMDPNMIVPDFAESAKYIEGSVQDHLHVYATGAVKDPMARLQFYVLFMQLPWLTMSGWGGGNLRGDSQALNGRATVFPVSACACFERSLLSLYFVRN